MKRCDSISVRLMLGALLWGVCLVGSVVAAPSAETPPVEDSAATEAAKKALNGRTYFPWYDAARDDLRRIDVRAQKDDANANRGSQWENAPSPQSTQPVAGPGFSAFSEILTVLIYLIIGGLIVAVIVLLVRAFIRRETQVLIHTGEVSEEELVADVDRVENLPFKVAAPKGDMLSEAERCYRAGDYNSAIIYLFSYELMQLDKAQIIRLTRGKTNRQYVRETQSRRELAAILRNTMMAFEDVFFGHHSLERERFEYCWQELSEFQRWTNAAEVAV